MEQRKDRVLGLSGATRAAKVGTEGSDLDIHPAEWGVDYDDFDQW